MSTTHLPDRLPVRVDLEPTLQSGSRRYSAPESLLTAASVQAGRDLDIVRSVHACRLMCAKQIERLHFAGNGSPATTARICRRVLKRLSGQDILRRRERRIGGIRAGSASFIYSLGPKGARLVTDTRLHYYVRDPSDYFMQHTLELAELYVTLHEQHCAGGCELLDIQTEPSCWRTFLTLATGMQTLKPDMYVRLGIRNEETSYFVEVDRGTTYATSLLKKLRTYESYYLTGKEERAYGVFPQVLWIVPDERRRAKLNRLCMPFNERIPDLFVVSIKGQALAVMLGAQPP